jgi:hypothetical protein
VFFGAWASATSPPRVAPVNAITIFAAVFNSWTDGVEIKPTADSCLDVPSEALSQAFLQSFRCHGGSNQRWHLDFDDHGLVSIRSKQSQLCMDRPNGDVGFIRIQQYPCHGGMNQKWQLYAVNNSDPFDIPYLQVRTPDGAWGLSLDPGGQGESPNVFGDALRRLAAAATYLYQDGPRYWYSTQPTVTKLAEDRAEQLKRDPDKVVQELDKRLRADLRKTGDFNRVHPLPASSADVPDDLDARLVVLGVDHAYTKDPDNAAETAAKVIFEKRGNAPRLFRNTIVFLAADKTRLQDLYEAVRKFLAWESILDEKDRLDLSPHQVKQAETQRTADDGVVTARLPETYQWVLAPTQANPQAPVTWQTIRLSGQDALAERTSKKLKNDELLVTNFAASRLRMELDRVPLWRGDHVPIRQLVEDFGRYLYLPRLQTNAVLLDLFAPGLLS